MLACEACSSAASFIFPWGLDEEFRKSSGQSFPSRSLLQIRQNSKSCGFCNFIASEIQKFTQKKNLDVKDDALISMYGVWENYRPEGVRTCSRILEYIRFEVRRPVWGQGGSGCTVGKYPVCIETSALTPLGHLVLIPFSRLTRY
jgi:hypothetical protein